MGASLTVADSKRAFHTAFPHVIAPLYRRLVDELLVELHLLSHQQGFQADGLFAVGLTQVFDSFSQGYRPEQQREPLFIALCAANGFDGPALRTQAEQARSGVGHHSLEEVKGWLSNRGRQNAASWLAKSAGVDWRWGAWWFESQLLDHDVGPNWGNWQYVAGVGNDPRNRIFDVRAQAQRYDEDGAYRARWGVATSA